MKKVWILASAVVLTGGVAVAQSLAEKKIYAEQQSRLEDSVKSTNEKCGTTIAVGFDWKSFNGVDLQDGSHSVYGYCEAPLNMIRRICDDSKEGAAAVKKDIKKYTCAWGGKGKRDIKLAAGTLTYKIDWDSSNDEDYAKAYLEKHL